MKSKAAREDACESGSTQGRACQERQQDGVFRRCKGSGEGAQAPKAGAPAKPAGKPTATKAAPAAAKASAPAKTSEGAQGNCSPQSPQRQSQPPSRSPSQPPRKQPPKRRASGKSRQRRSPPPAASRKTSAKPWLESYPENVPAEIAPLTAGSIGDLLVNACKRYAGRPAFTCMGKSLTFGELERQSAAFGAYLQSKGLAKGARVAIMMPNVLQYPVAMMGILRAGYTVVNINPLYTPRELEHQLKDSGAEAIIILENFAVHAAGGASPRRRSSMSWSRPWATCSASRDCS